MKKLNKGIALLLSAVMVAGSLTACGSSETAAETTAKEPAATEAAATEAVETTAATESAAEDTIVALLPPVSGTYQDNFDKWCTQFHEMYPNLTLEIEAASWEDMTDKLDVQVQAGSPPDIAFVGSTAVTKYIDTELLMDVSQIASADVLGDFDEDVLNYFKNGDGIYGFPAYASIQSIGGNKAMLEEAGIDWEKVQKDGWTYDEFREAIKAGTVGDRYGFVYACSGVAAADYLNIFVKNAGMPAAFDENLKYAYTSQNFLHLLEDIRTLIDDGSMPKELSSIDAGKRWNMFLTGQTMITGKGLATFENSANGNNKKLQEKDPEAVEGSIEAEYIVLPVPTFFDCPQQAQCAVDGYVCFRGKDEPTPEHLANVVKAMEFLATGEIAATTCTELFLSPVCESGKTAAAALPAVEGKNESNTACVESLLTQIAPARPDITPELGAAADKLMTEVITPKFQALLAGELSPQEMYDAVKEAAVDEFGEDGIVVD